MTPRHWVRKRVADIRNDRKYTLTTLVINCSFLLSSFGDRLWMFAIGLFIHQLGGISWIAIQQLCDSASKLLLNPILGRYLDRLDRLKGIQLVLLVNNVSIAISAGIFYFSFSGFASAQPSWVSTVLLCFAIVFGSISRVASEAQQTAFTKDWIVVMVDTYEGARLSSQNTLMNCMYQLAGFLSPIVTGSLMTNFSNQVTCYFIIGLNLVLWVMEASILLWIYKARLPELAHRKEVPLTEQIKSPSPFAAYLRQKSVKAAFGLSLLYMTVLGFDNLALSYGAKQGMSPQALGNFRAIGSVMGFTGGITYSILERCSGVLVTAAIGLALQNFFINWCSLSVFLPGSPFAPVQYFSTLTLQSWWNTVVENVVGTQPTDAPRLFENGTLFNENATSLLDEMATSEAAVYSLTPSLLVFFCGISIARFGLWVADPAITQIMQETIPEHERYSVFGVQTAFCEFFSVLKDVLVILFSANEIFGGLTIVSCFFVGTGFIFYMLYFCQEYGRKEAPNDEESLPEKNHLLNKNLVDRALNS